MRMTMKDIYKLICEKKENAELDLEREYKKDKLERNYKNIWGLESEIKAYYDIQCLIESSGVLDGN